MPFKTFMLFLLLTLQLHLSAQKQHPSSLLVHHPFHPHTMPHNQQKLHQHHHHPRYPFGVYFPQKRKVPNASDPLHNR
ncbi:hypothetical protein PHAVU_001G025500 [Phaseolus vulgaris]|uniref:Uncharacterized protein n=1 Tax=Phaseolus vulgaris TaxID=3885 RepID=V7CU17_PHAVU|nr:hypothetical protein PHAVU_001G025500g [Phaseolus vulgaris]ESW32883.1 hypothetical protein PHAVU_001G025500g [Phaseolus vulgaris]